LCKCYIIWIEQNMKKIEIDGKKLIIYEDGSIRIPHKDMHLCLDFMDIVSLYNESMKARNEREPDSKDTELIVKRSICMKSYQKVKAMKLNDQKIERRRFKRHNNLNPKKRQQLKNWCL
jgi:hypothetical protein